MQYRIGQGQGRVADIAAANIQQPCDRIGQRQYGCIRTVLFERLRDFVTFFAGRLTRKADVVRDDWRDRTGGLIGPHQVDEVFANGDEFGIRFTGGFLKSFDRGLRMEPGIVAKLHTRA